MQPRATAAAASAAPAVTDPICAGGTEAEEVVEEDEVTRERERESARAQMKRARGAEEERMIGGGLEEGEKEVPTEGERDRDRERERQGEREREGEHGGRSTARGGALSVFHTRAGAVHGAVGGRCCLPVK